MMACATCETVILSSNESHSYFLRCQQKIDDQKILSCAEIKMFHNATSHLAQSCGNTQTTVYILQQTVIPNETCQEGSQIHFVLFRVFSTGTYPIVQKKGCWEDFEFAYYLLNSYPCGESTEGVCGQVFSLRCNPQTKVLGMNRAGLCCLD